MTLPDFITGLELELRLRAAPFDRAELVTRCADVRPLADEDPNPIRWAEAFLTARREAASTPPLA
jgi:hypothetical protein